LRFIFFQTNYLHRKVREISCGASYSTAISESRHFYYWGKLPNSPRGEATIYPQMQQELYDWKVKSIGSGSSFITVVSEGVAILWDAPVSGRYGLEGDAKSTVAPKFLDSLKNLEPIDVTAGYGHCCYIVRDNGSEESRTKLAAFPALPQPTENENLSTTKKATSGSAGSKSVGIKRDSSDANKSKSKKRK